MRELTAITNELVAAGFTLAPGHRHHPVWRCPCGHGLLTAQSSKSGGSAYKNLRAQIRRTLRDCKTNLESSAA